jgi:cation diffusion facilitator family transporter
LTGLKLGVGYLSGSVGVLSEGVHSFLDLVSAAIAFVTVREAGKPADREHPFGHGKIETLSALFESLLLLLAAGLIVSEGIEHLRHPMPMEHQGLAIATIAFSLGVSWLMYRHNLAAARQTESPAIHVNALHFLADAVASVGILAGLILLRLTGWLVIDPIMAFLVAGYILLISARQVLGSLRDLADTQLPEAEVSRIREILASFREKTIEAHDLRTRRSGSTRHIDFHLVVCGHLSVHESHAVCDDIEARLLGAYPGASVTIHVEPCENGKTGCEATCPIHQAARSRKE